MELIIWCITLVSIVAIICYTAYRLQLAKEKAAWRDELASVNKMLYGLDSSFEYIKGHQLELLTVFKQMHQAVNTIAKDTYTLTHPNTNK